MKALDEAVARIALEVHPDRIASVCSALRRSKDTNLLDVVNGTLGTAFSPRLIEGLAGALKATPRLSAGTLAAMFRGASATAALAAGASSAELVWTGPATTLVPVRHTAQVLAGLIDDARGRLFLVSFVAYHVGVVVDALQRAVERGVRLRILLERSQEHGGNVTVDSSALLRRSLPRAQFYAWNRDAPSGAPGASVHAKCAVADGSVAFITSANLTEAAMDRNMELGVLLRGGQPPALLDRHLHALITTRQLTLL